MNIIIAQILRIIGSIFGIIADKSDEPKKIYFFNGIYNLACSVQYFLLNAITGAISSFICIFRNIIFYKYKKKVPMSIVLVYFLITILINIPGYTGLISIMPILLTIIYTMALYIENIIFFKFSIIAVCILEIIYDIAYDAYVGIAICIIDIIVVTISLIRYKEKNKQKSIS